MRIDDVFLVGVFVIISSSVHYLTNAALSSECPGNDVEAIRQQALQFELSLVLYYVSWCRESTRAKDIYKEIARNYKDEANFAAVDCWHLECNCSRTMTSTLGSKKGYPQKWPTLIVHYNRHLALQYRDEWSVVALTRFISNILEPVVRLNSRDELKLLNMQSNAVLLGLFQNASAIGYHRFVNTAIKWLDRDPDRLVRFGVCFGAAANDTARGLGTSTPLIVLIREKDIEVFHFSENWTSNHLIAWLLGEFKRISRHLTGFSTPLLLMDHVRKGAVLAIFANDCEHPQMNFYMQMSSVMDHHQLFGFTYSFAINSNLKKCEKFSEPDDHEKIFNRQDKLFYELQLKDELNGILVEHDRGFCKARLKINNGYGPLTMLKMNQDYSKMYITKFQPTVQFQSQDHRSAMNLIKFYRYNECLKLHQRQNTPQMQIIFAKFITKFIERFSQESITRQNRTLSVQIMDASKYQDILHNLGLVDLEKIEPESKKTTVLIIEPNQEGVYKMEKSFSYEALLQFIKDYYNENLYILRRTKVNRISSTSINSSCPDKHKDSEMTFCLNELSRQAFLHKIQHFWQNTTTVLLLYTPRCAFSSMMSHSLVQVSAMLHSSPQAININIVRLSTQTNDLPWEFITHVTPALIVFPRGHPSESRIFPANLRIDVRNVFAFILAQLEPIEQVRVALGTCSSTPLPQQLIKCLHFVKTLAMQHISDHLKLWQVFENQRKSILTRLKQFKDITLDIQKKFLL